MKPVVKLSRSSKVFIVLTLLYVGLTFVLPANIITKAELGITDQQYFALLMVIRIPIIAVWCLAFYAYRRLHDYTQIISGTTEGKHFATITRGVSWIVWGMPVPAILSSILNAIANQDANFLRVALIITNYAYVVVALFAFSYISAGAHRFARQAKVQPTTTQIRWLVFVLVAIGVLFTYLINARLDGTSPINSYNAYYLPNFLVWASIVVPYLYAWFLGIFAALELLLVAKKTSGVIYKHALQYVAFGLVIIVLSLCFMQYYRAVVPRTGHLTIGITLLMTYLTYICSALGSLVLAFGARRLKRIEEI